MSRALTALLALALAACSELADHSLGGEQIVPVDAGGIFDVGTFPFDIEECIEVQDALRARLLELLVARPDAEAGIPQECVDNPFLLECPQRELLRQVYDCAGLIRQRFLDEANASGLR